tara:strand:+ start:1956 stop:5150 length:3195 start_codon:yes stop_codon:yes gene_type:complete
MNELLRKVTVTILIFFLFYICLKNLSTINKITEPSKWANRMYYNTSKWKAINSHPELKSTKEYWKNKTKDAWNRRKPWTVRKKYGQELDKSIINKNYEWKSNKWVKKLAAIKTAAVIEKPKRSPPPPCSSSNNCVKIWEGQWINNGIDPINKRMTIESATYQSPRYPYNSKDVTNIINNKIYGGKFPSATKLTGSLRVTNSEMGGDVDRGVKKYVAIVFKPGTGIDPTTCSSNCVKIWEGSSLSGQKDIVNRRPIISAIYQSPNDPYKFKDVKSIIDTKIYTQGKSMQVTNKEMGDDVHRGVKKYVAIVFEEEEETTTPEPEPNVDDDTKDKYIEYINKFKSELVKFENAYIDFDYKDINIETFKSDIEKYILPDSKSDDSNLQNLRNEIINMLKEDIQSVTSRSSIIKSKITNRSYAEYDIVNAGSESSSISKDNNCKYNISLSKPTSSNLKIAPWNNNTGIGCSAHDLLSNESTTICIDNYEDYLNKIIASYIINCITFSVTSSLEDTEDAIKIIYYWTSTSSPLNNNNVSSLFSQDIITKINTYLSNISSVANGDSDSSTVDDKSIMPYADSDIWRLNGKTGSSCNTIEGFQESMTNCTETLEEARKNVLLNLVNVKLDKDNQYVTSNTNTDLLARITNAVTCEENNKSKKISSDNANINSNLNKLITENIECQDNLDSVKKKLEYLENGVEIAETHNDTIKYGNKIDTSEDENKINLANKHVETCDTVVDYISTLNDINNSETFNDSLKCKDGNKMSVVGTPYDKYNKINNWTNNKNFNENQMTRLKNKIDTLDTKIKKKIYICDEEKIIRNNKSKLINHIKSGKNNIFPVLSPDELLNDITEVKKHPPSVANEDISELIVLGTNQANKSLYYNKYLITEEPVKNLTKEHKCKSMSAGDIVCLVNIKDFSYFKLPSKTTTKNILDNTNYNSLWNGGKKNLKKDFLIHPYKFIINKSQTPPSTIINEETINLYNYYGNINIKLEHSWNDSLDYSNLPIIYTNIVTPSSSDEIKFNYTLNGDTSNKYYIVCLQRKTEAGPVDTNNYCDNMPAFFKEANISNY